MRLAFERTIGHWLVLLALALSGCQNTPPAPPPVATRPPTPTPYPLGPGLPRLLPAAETQAALLQGVPFLEERARERPTAAEYARPGTIYFHLDTAPNETLLWGYLWCAKDKESLDAEVENIQITFRIGAQALPATAWQQETRPDASGRPCQLFYLGLHDWPPGTHHLRLQVQLQQALPPYPAGEYILHYVVNVHP